MKRGVAVRTSALVGADPRGRRGHAVHNDHADADDEHKTDEATNDDASNLSAAHSICKAPKEGE